MGIVPYQYRTGTSYRLLHNIHSIPHGKSMTIFVNSVSFINIKVFFLMEVVWYRTVWYCTDILVI